MCTFYIRFYKHVEKYEKRHTKLLTSIERVEVTMDKKGKQENEGKNCGKNSTYDISISVLNYMYVSK